MPWTLIPKHLAQLDKLEIFLLGLQIFPFGDHFELADIYIYSEWGWCWHKVEVVMMDTVRGAIRASGGIWVEGENSRQETEEFLQKNWSRWKIGQPAVSMYVGKCLTIEYYIPHFWWNNWMWEYTIFNCSCTSCFSLVADAECVYAWQLWGNKWSRNTALKKHMKIARAAIFHAACQANNL